MEYLIILSEINCKDEEKEQVKLYKLLELIEVSSGCQNLTKRIKFQHFYLTEAQFEEACQEKKSEIVFNSHKTITKEIRRAESPVKRRLDKYYEPLKNKFIDLCARKHV